MIPDLQEEDWARLVCGICNRVYEYAHTTISGHAVHIPLRTLSWRTYYKTSKKQALPHLRVIHHEGVWGNATLPQLEMRHWMLRHLSLSLLLYMCVCVCVSWGWGMGFSGIQNLPLGMSKDALSLEKQCVHKIKLYKNMHQICIYLSIYLCHLSMSRFVSFFFVCFFYKKTKKYILAISSW